MWCPRLQCSDYTKCLTLISSLKCKLNWLLIFTSFTLSLPLQIEISASCHGVRAACDLTIDYLPSFIFVCSCSGPPWGPVLLELLPGMLPFPLLDNSSFHMQFKICPEWSLPLLFQSMGRSDSPPLCSHDAPILPEILDSSPVFLFIFSCELQRPAPD